MVSTFSHRDVVFHSLFLGMLFTGKTIFCSKVYRKAVSAVGVFKFQKLKILAKYFDKMQCPLCAILCFNFLF